MGNIHGSQFCGDPFTERDEPGMVTRSSIGTIRAVYYVNGISNEAYERFRLGKNVSGLA